MEIYAPIEDFGPDKQNKEDTSCTIGLLANVVCEEFGVTINELCSSEKRRELVRARAVLCCNLAILILS